MLTSTTRRAALAEARSWFSAPERARVYDAFQAVYLAPLRALFLEGALQELGRDPRRVLDVGCGTGEGLVYLMDRLPGAEIVGVDPAREMLVRAAERTGGRCRIEAATLDELGAGAGTFDLILSYSTFRFWEEPAAALRKTSERLSAGGLAFVQDLRRDMDDALRSMLLQQMETPELEAFLASQIEAAYSLPEVCQIIEDSAVPGCALCASGLAGLTGGGREPLTVLQGNPRLAPLLLRLSSGGFRVPRGAASVFHLSLRACANR